ncbi:MarC family protein [Planomonospora sp. ID82291]|uniref:MarC family protein n=1 Tax=Planomonospora sp. ID82291 TaxID=2738136 RepID=UPI0018C435CE|nr:MarC family protein [Planomonospora sp. ID82291]MBG0815130.1 MarC family protein [Planomonospora sp. ID82291]
MFDIQFFVEAFVTMFVIMDPPGIIPLFLAYTGGLGTAERKRIAWQAPIVAFCLVVLFAVFGQAILGYLHVEVAAMQIAGGLLLLLVALQLLTGETEPPANTMKSNVNVALVPLGTPLLAGPGAIVATIVFAQQAEAKSGGILALALAIGVVHILLWVFMRFSLAIVRVVKENGIELVTRIAGLLLSALAVQLIITAMRTLLGVTP